MGRQLWLSGEVGTRLGTVEQGVSFDSLRAELEIAAAAAKTGVAWTPRVKKLLLKHCCGPGAWALDPGEQALSCEAAVLIDLCSFSRQ